MLEQFTCATASVKQLVTEKKKNQLERRKMEMVMALFFGFG